MELEIEKETERKKEKEKKIFSKLKCQEKQMYLD